MLDETEDAEARDAFPKVLTSDSVRERVIEFLGGDGLDPGTASCVFLCAGDMENPARAPRLPLSELESLLEGPGGVARSLYDVHSVLVHLDVEYVNFDQPERAFTDPWRAFRVQEPVVEVIEELLVGWGICPLHVLTGQGHHFVWSFPRDSELARRLAHLVPSADAAGGEQVFANLALLMEFFAHRIKTEAAGRVAVPVEITALQVPFPASGERELVSLDISEYGDPLESRRIRVPFTLYAKPWFSGLAARHGVEGLIGPCVTIPLHEMDAMQALKCRQDAADVASLSRRCRTRIPEEEVGTGHLLEEYLGSPLCAFHRSYYEAQHDAVADWPSTYGRTPLHELPGCVRHVLTHPNDLLLKPSGMRLVTRCLLAKGWHPRHIAGLVRSKFEDPAHGWGDCWESYSPTFRADFYVRLFAGQLATGLDRLDDFHCDKVAKGDFCWPGDPPCDLRPYRDILRP